MPAADHDVGLLATPPAFVADKCSPHRVHFHLVGTEAQFFEGTEQAVLVMGVESVMNALIASARSLPYPKPSTTHRAGPPQACVRRPPSLQPCLRAVVRDP